MDAPTTDPTSTGAASNPSTPERSPQAPQTYDEAQQTQQFTPEDVQEALRYLVRVGEIESDFARRGHYRQMLEAEEFWKGNQYPIWSEKEFTFRTPWDFALEKNRLEDQPVYQYVLNMYQAYGLTVVAALSQRVPKVRFFPHSTRNEVDIATARAASDIAELIEKNNKIRFIAMREAYLLWTQGGFGTYVRFVRDKRKGVEQIPQIEQMQIPVSDDGYQCPNCGQNSSASEAGMQSTVDEMGQEGSVGACPACNTPLSDSHFVPGESATVPVVSAIHEMPEGYEKMSVYGMLNLKLQPYSHTFEESGYLGLVMEAHEGSVRASYPALQDKIGGSNQTGQGASAGSGGVDAYERVGRMKLFDASQPYSGLRSAPTKSYITYRRYWLRDWYMYAHPEIEMRKKLIEMFPNGAFVAFADDMFLEARPEDVDEMWTICSAMPSYGIYAPAIGASTIPLQKQLNDASNIVAEHIDFGTAPPTFIDAEFLSTEGLRNQKMRPATLIPVMRKRGAMTRSLQDLMHQPTIKIDSNIYSYGRSLMEIAPTINGAMPTLFGGQLKGNETLGAYQQSRDQAMGKLQLFWASVKQHHADTMRLAVECFRKNRTQDAEKVVLGKSNDYIGKYIRLEDIKGTIFAEPEADEDFPAQWSEIRDNLQAMIKTSPEWAMQILNDPANSTLLRKFIASPQVQFPAEDNREKQFMEIDELVAGAPVGVPDPMSPPDPVTGQPQIKWMPTVMPDVHGDDHIVHVKAIMEWVVDPQGGIMAKKENPEGYANTMAHLIAHKEAIAELAQYEMMLQQKYGLLPPPVPAVQEKESGGPPAESAGGPPVAGGGAVQ
jgi:hypothetical protein